MADWQKAQEGELKYWQRAGCVWGEHEKQLSYFHHMKMWENYGLPDYELDMRGQSILDIGCGPASSLLRMTNAARLTGVDPLDYGAAAKRRYKAFGIEYYVQKAEDLSNLGVYDLGLMYNVLQHPENPELIVKQLIKHAHEIRIFEWLNIPTDSEHLHTLTVPMLLNWFAGCKVQYIAIPRVTECHSNADAFVGIFETC